jgi:imidazolonepropionase-like amidohydrolase
MMAGLAAVQAGLRAAEAVAAVTYVAAASLRLEGRKGALAEGHDADFLVYDLASVDEWLADFGRTLPREVWVSGRKAFWRAPGPV